MKKKFALIIVELDADENGVVDECVLDEQALTFGDEDIQRIIDDNAESKRLTQREKDVLVSILKGHRRKDTANELYVTESTIKKHSRAIYAKFGVKDRFELLSKLYRMKDEIG